MNKSDVINLILKDRKNTPKTHSTAKFAPSNIALIKYWGKRDNILNLPMTDSLSLSLGNKGATTSIEIIDKENDEFYLNNEIQNADSPFSLRLSAYLDLFRFKEEHYRVRTQLNIPLAAGLASSACGFAALVLALNDLYAWELSLSELSILARLGSGSACRSLYKGFAWWQKGIHANGMDSYAIPLETEWPELRIGLLIVDGSKKLIDSRSAMERTVKTSQLYAMWAHQVAHDFIVLNEAILDKDFVRLGEVSEHNALSMHATMISAWPPIVYSNADTVNAMHAIWELRKQGLELYFTQDAGPNLKLLFLEKDSAVVKEHFPGVEIID